MTDRSKSAEAIFAEAVDLPPGSKRNDFVRDACQDVVETYREVESLLRSHDQAESFFDLPVEGLKDSDLFDQASQFAGRYLEKQSAFGRPMVDEFMERVPESLKAETRDRIQIALKARARLKGLGEFDTGSGPETVPEILGFTIEKQIGSGSVGKVYRALDDHLGRPVAIKIFHCAAQNAQPNQMFDEARKTATLDDPSIVTIHNVVPLESGENVSAIVMEWVDGVPCDEFAESLSFRDKALLLQKIVQGLAHAHRNRMIHRDLKPQNILVTKAMQPKILDFGLALYEGEEGGGAGFFEGTPLYASPEQVAGLPLTSASDMFSFGSVMFCLLTGQPPFKGESVRDVLDAIATTHPPYLSDIAVGIPQELQAICFSCLSWDPENRPSAKQVGLELERYLSGIPIKLRPALYSDIVRKRVSGYTNELSNWNAQGMISREEYDRLQLVFRRLLADEDHWIVDTRKLSFTQILLYSSSWIVVTTTCFLVWLIRDKLSADLQWILPCLCTFFLLGIGSIARLRQETLAATSFLTGGLISALPTSVAVLSHFRVLDFVRENEVQLVAETFTNQQIVTASFIAMTLSVFTMFKVRMTGFAWTTAVLTTLSYLSALLLLNWLDQDIEVMALWCLPLIGLEVIAIRFEAIGRVRWATPFGLVPLIVLLVSCDLMAFQGAYMNWLGMGDGFHSILTDERQVYLSFALNGYLYLLLMLLTERSQSLNLRRVSPLLEFAAISHIVGSLFLDALVHQDLSYSLIDVAMLLVASAGFLALSQWRSRWRLFVGSMVGLSLGAFLLLRFEFVKETHFVF
ncbi:MAG: serine/threonine protein kinase, partial [Verrucomicrobia bacterium]|nr:serine/threonine protein kinase [Verrucomicrobiota bacterium]